MDKRKIARDLAKQSIAKGHPLDWFEELYSKSETEGINIPWADLIPNPNLVDFMTKNRKNGKMKKALKIGCGLGDDAEYLSDLGFDVVAFDISPTAIHIAKRRFPNSAVHYCVEDIFSPPREWENRFGFVLESYTLQVLPPELRNDAIHVISSFVTPGGDLLVISRARDINEYTGDMPWPLTESEIRHFEKYGLTCQSFEDYIENEEQPIRRFRVHWKKL